MRVHSSQPSQLSPRSPVSSGDLSHQAKVKKCQLPSIWPLSNLQQVACVWQCTQTQWCLLRNFQVTTKLPGTTFRLDRQEHNACSLQLNNSA